MRSLTTLPPSTDGAAALDGASPVGVTPPPGRLVWDPTACAPDGRFEVSALAEPDDVRTILHVDLDCFFVSVERVLDPSLSGRPVIVGGTGDRGVVCSASMEARAHGVTSAMATSIARRLCPDAVFLPGRMRLYARASAAAFRVFREVTQRVERASIDEAYLDITEAVARRGSSFDVAAHLQRSLGDRLGLPCSAGVAANKLVAKVACGQAKPAGVMEVWSGYEAAFLSPLPVSDLPGVGPVLAGQLELYGLKTVGDLARVHPTLLEGTFGRAGRRLAAAAQGRGPDECSSDEEPKSIGRERTLTEDCSDTARLFEEVHGLADEVGHRLRRRGLKGRTITLKLKDADFEISSRSRTLRAPTDSESEIANVAWFLLRELRERDLRRAGRSRRPVRLIGVSVSRFEDEPAQASLFPELGVSAAQAEARAAGGPVAVTGAGVHSPAPGEAERWIDWAAALPARIFRGIGEEPGGRRDGWAPPAR